MLAILDSITREEFMLYWETCFRTLRSKGLEKKLFRTSWLGWLFCEYIQVLERINKLTQFTFRVVHRIITTKKELLKYKLASDDKCPFCLNPDSIEHTFLYCQESKEFFSKTLRWFNEYHKENVQLSNKQILFNTFDDSLPMQMPNSTQSKLRLLVLLQKKYLYTCKNIVTKPNLEDFLRKLFEQYHNENCGKQYWICVAN